MKVIFLTLLLSFQILYAQNNQLGLQLNYINSYNASNLDEADDFEGNVDQTKNNTLDFGIFFDQSGEKRYHRFQLDIRLSSITSKQDVTRGDRRTFSESTRTPVSNRLNGEIGKIWRIADRLEFRAGLLASFSLTYPSPWLTVNKIYEANQIVSWSERSSRQGLIFEAGLGPVLRLHYNISDKMQLGLALPYGINLRFSNYSNPYTDRTYDSNGMLTNEIVIVEKEKLAFLTSAPIIRPLMTFGLFLGNKGCSPDSE